jgi:methylenetetrahydrofolate dehydrogenase (NADP+)/methenyltetrahydrofolate cyclohydrolase
LKSFTLQADILIAATGIPEFITGDMVKPGAVVIDVGINRVDDSSNPKGFRLTGDVHFLSVEPVSSYISPVPGGVGQLTVMALIQNTLLAAERKD